MKSMELVCGYSTDDNRREKLYPLFETVFGIDVDLLKDFHCRGFWNPTYRPYTLFDGERAVANVSCFSMPLMISQKMVQAVGIQSVMTHPDYRGRGLMKHLFQEMLNDIDKEYETALLLTSAPELYLPFGFRIVQEYTYVTPMKHTPVQGKQKLRKLIIFNEDDLQLVKECFQKHTPVSGQFATVSHESSFYLNMYNPYFQQKLYYSEELQLLLVYAVIGETLKLYDCIGEKLPGLEALCACIPEPFLQVEFSFYPDLFHLKNFQPVAFDNGTKLMVRGRFDVENNACKLPETAAF